MSTCCMPAIIHILIPDLQRRNIVLIALDEETDVMEIAQVILLEIVELVCPSPVWMPFS